MRIFRVQDGSSWTARIDAEAAAPADRPRVGWEAVLFEPATPGAAARLVYRPAGWLRFATVQELVSALQEGEAVRARWEPESGG